MVTAAAVKVGAGVGRAWGVRGAGGKKGKAGLGGYIQRL